MTGTEGTNRGRNSPDAARNDRSGARSIDLLIEAAVGLAIASVFSLSDRPLAAVAVAWCVATTYEAAAIVMFGSTVGKATRRLRVIALDNASDRVPVDQALPRAAAATAGFFGPVACFVAATTNAAPAVVPLGILWAAATIASTSFDPLGRGPADRVASTIVVPTDVDPPIRSRDLAGYADAVRPPRTGPWGRVGDLDVRGRARLRRLNDAPPLVAVVVLLVLASAVPVARGLLLAGTGLLWLVAFVVDETRRVSGAGTYGHRLAGLVVLDRSSGCRPGRGRSFVRALALGLMLYVPIFWPLLGVSMIMIRADGEGRGLHDRIAGTVVVADPALDPETQRRMAMRVRLGRVG